MKNDKSDKDMEDNKSDKELKDDKEEKSSEDEDEVEKSSFQESIKSNMNTLTDVIKSLAETQKDVSSTLTEQNNALVNIGERLKALETPTDLPLKPKQSDKEDIGAKVTIPDTYQSNSVQVGLHDDKEAENKPKSDPSGLKMQEKSNFDFTTETPRPNAAIETINKSTTDMSYVLKDAREGGNLSVVARNILAGKYYTPTPDEVGTY
jgi:molybdopterin converting factor small subunit